MVISEECEAKRRAMNERWKELFRAEKGCDPRIDISLYADTSSNPGDLINSKFVKDDDGGRIGSRKVLLMQIMTSGGMGPGGAGFVTGTVLVDPTPYEVLKLLENLAEPLGLSHYIETYFYAAERDGHDRSSYTHRGVACMIEKCWQERTGEWVKDTFTNELIAGPVAWEVDWMNETGDYARHTVLGLFASREEAEERLKTVMEDDPEVTMKGGDAFDKTFRRKIRPYQLRGNRGVRPKEVWACILSSQCVKDEVYAVYDSKEGAQLGWEKKEGCKLPDLSKGMVDAPDGEHGVEIRRFPF